MKRLILVTLFAGLLIGHTPPRNQVVESAPQTQIVLLKLVPGTVSEENFKINVSEISISSLQNVLQKFSVTTMQSIFKNRYTEIGKLKKEIVGKNLLSGWFQLTIANPQSINELIVQLKSLNVVMDALVEVPITLRADIAPNDSNYGTQWHLNNTSNPNFDINAEAAWDINRGRNDVVIAVLDGGVDYTHTDLDPGNRSRVIAGTDTGDDDSDPMDDLPDSNPDSFAGHGTKVAGVIGARTDNNQQMAGVMWNCSIMPVKMVRSGGIRIPHILNWDWSTSAFPSDVADAIDFSVNNGAHVINLSYSFPSMGWPVNEVIFRVPLIYDALNNAYQNNVVITASMGNQSIEDNSVRYPAGFKEQVMAVGATTQSGVKAGFSNSGSHISISAPGVGIGTTARGGGISFSNGTSFSAPMVAGVAGLVISQGKDRGFNLTNDDVRKILELTANGQVGTSPGFDNETGHGLVNAHTALQLLASPNTVLHGNSVGGTATQLGTLSSWTLLDNRWGIAAGTYYQVEQHRVTKHITFATPFCGPPQVWMRSRESASLSYASPNDCRPFSIISNVTATGFDIEYVTYYVKFNGSGQTINQWIPAAPASTNVAYTAIGVPVGPLSGPANVCLGGTTFSLGTVPSGASVTWQATPSNLFTASSGSFTGAGTSHTITLSAAGSLTSGQGTLTVNVNCGSLTQLTSTFWVGVPSITNPTVNTNPYFTNYPVCPGPNFLNVTPTGTNSIAEWTVPPGISHLQGYNLLDFTMPTSPSTITITAKAGNVCGNSKAYSFKLVKKTSGCGQSMMTAFPNPVAEELVVTPTSNNTALEVALTDSNGSVVFTSKSAGSSPILIPVRDFKSGRYVLTITENGIAEKQHILVAH